jgi:hypothetical protein
MSIAAFPVQPSMISYSMAPEALVTPLFSVDDKVSL